MTQEKANTGIYVSIISIYVRLKRIRIPVSTLHMYNRVLVEHEARSVSTTFIVTQP